MRNLLYRFGKFQLTTGARELRREGERVPLPRRAYDCLLYLIEQRERAVGRDELTAAVWGRVDVTDAQLSQIMLHARRAVDDSGQAQTAIRTLPGFGYHWIAETEERAEPDDAASITAEAISPMASGPSEDGEFGSANLEEAQHRRPASPPHHVSRTSSTARRARRRWLFAASALAALIVAAAAVLLGRHLPSSDAAAEADAASAALAVLPLEVTGPSDSGWVRLGAMDLIAERLRGSGLAVPPSENVLIALRSAAGSDGARHLGGNLGVGILVEGKAIQSTEGWTIELAAARGETQRYTASAKHADVIHAARQAADLLLAAMGRTPSSEHAENSDLDERLQQAQAAMLAGELDTASKILAALPEPDAPRVRLMQTLIEARSGRLDQADAAYGRLIADPAVRADPLLYGRALSYRGWVRARLENYVAAESDYDAAVTALQDSRSSIDLARALNGRGGVRIANSRFDEAAADLGRARIELQRSGDRLGVIQSDTNFGLLEYRRDRFEQALQYLLRAADEFEAFGAVERVMGVLTVAFDAEAALWRWSEALAITDRQWKYRSHSGDPGLLLKMTVNRGEALLMLGRLREAQELAAQAEREHADTRHQARRYLQGLLAKIAWSRGNYEEAAAAADRGLALWGAEDPDEERDGAQLVLLRQRALIATGKARADSVAREHVPATANPSPFLLLARAERAAWQGRPNDAEANFRLALQQAEARGVPIGLVAVGQAYGRWLLTQHRIDEAAGLAGRLAPWADRDFDVAVFQAAVLNARGDRVAAAHALQQARAVAGEREVPSELQVAAAK